MSSGKKRFKQMVRKQMRMPQFGALGEVLLWHEEKTAATVRRGDGTVGPPPKVIFPPNHPRVQGVLSAAIKRGWPFVAHIEFRNIPPIAERNDFMEKFENMLRRNPGLEGPVVLVTEAFNRAMYGDRSPDREEQRAIQEAIRSRLGQRIYGEDEDTLEGVIDSILYEKKLTLAIFETFSGGRMALKFYRIHSKHLKESRVIKDKKLVAQLLSLAEIVPNTGKALELAEKVRKSVHADIGAATLGFPEYFKGETYRVKGFTAVKLSGVEKSFSWSMGGELEIIKERAAVIGLNTLRLALL